LRTPAWSLAVANIKIHPTPFAPQQSVAALPIKKFANKYGVHPSTVWRALRDGRLQYILIGKRKFILPPVVQRD
jgi:hypothetical protein